MKLGMYIVPPEAISTAYFIITHVRNTNTAASQIVEVIIFILLYIVPPKVISTGHYTDLSHQ
jgi:hypothetical protein